AVLVLDAAGENVGNGLDAAMRMPRKAGAVILGVIVAKVIEEQKRIERRRVAETEGAAQLNPGALDGRLVLDDALDGSYGHPVLRCGRLGGSRVGRARAKPAGEIESYHSIPRLNRCLASKRKNAHPCYLVTCACPKSAARSAKSWSASAT